MKRRSRSDDPQGHSSFLTPPFFCNFEPQLLTEESGNSPSTNDDRRYSAEIHELRLAVFDRLHRPSCLRTRDSGLGTLRDQDIPEYMYIGMSSTLLFTSSLLSSASYDTRSPCSSPRYVMLNTTILTSVVWEYVATPSISCYSF